MYTVQVSLTVTNTSQRLLNLDQGFLRLELGAATLEAAQIQQAEVQSQMHEQTLVDLDAVRGVLNASFSSVTELKAIVDSTTAIIGNLGSIMSMTGWLAPLSFGLTLIGCAYMISKRIAAFLCCSVGKQSIPSRLSFADGLLQLNLLRLFILCL